PALPQATIDTIRQWITNGATNDTQASSAAIRVSSVSPLPGSTVTTLPVAITPASVTVPTTNTHSAVMSLTGIASANDTYRITLSGSGAAKILDLSGGALDGEYTGRLPSGNGAAGGD